MTHLPAVFFAVFWIWADLLGVLLSVISTYFYFGWEGTPLLVPKVFAIALAAFSAPVCYRLLLQKRDPAQLQRTLLLLLFFSYLSLAVYRESDFFAWGTVLSTWLAGLCLMACLRTLGRWPIWSMPIYALVLSSFFYLSSRIAQAGVPLLLSSPQGVGLMGWATLGVFVLAGIFLPDRRHRPLGTEGDAPGLAGGLGLALGLLAGLSVGLVANLHLWSAKTEPMPAPAYFLPLGLGALLARAAWRRGQRHRPLLLIAAMLALAAGLVPLLYTGYDLPQGLLACGLASLGLYTLWCALLGRWHAIQQQTPSYFPWLGLQGGFVGLLLVLALFLLKAEPSGFWLALLLGGGLLVAIEAQSEPLELPRTPLDRLWLYSGAIFTMMGAMTLALPVPGLPAEAGRLDRIRIMSSNIRYGWSDDYRFEPFAHPRWLKSRLPDLLGLQEVNKGHTSGAYADDFRLYQKLLPGHWRYGDAHFGFGNALYTRYKILASEVRTYQAKDMLKRACLIVTVAIAGKPVEVFVTHLSHLPAPNPVREAQAAELVSWLKASQHPWILLGDFNATPDAPEIKQVKAVADEVFRKDPKLTAGLSFPAARPDRRIDYIFFSPAFELLRLEVLDNGVTTDHRPIYAELKLP